MQEFLLADCPGVEDSWMEIVGSQGRSLLKLDISNSLVTDGGLALVGVCTNLRSLTMDVCDDISDSGLSVLTRTNYLISPLSRLLETKNICK